MEHQNLKCLLICPENSHGPIELPNKSVVAVGRSAITQIGDQQVSRIHVEVVADYDKREVRVTQLGNKPSEIDGKPLAKGETATVKDGGSLYMLVGKHRNEVRFVYQLPFLKSNKRRIDDTRSSSNEDRNETETEPKKLKRSKLQETETKPKNLKLHETEEAKPKNVKLHETEEAKPKNVKLHETETKSKNLKQSKLQVVSGSVTGCKITAMAENNSDDEEHLENVEERLKMLRKNAENGGETSYDAAIASPTSTNVDRLVKQVESTYSWKEHEKFLMFTSEGVLPSSKIASFDIDSTIITTKSGRVFPTDVNDWKILYSEIFGKLKDLHSNGHKIVFFTNQRGFENGKVKRSEFETKVENILNRLGVPVQVFISTGTGKFRKPATGMWDYLKNHANDKIAIDYDSSCFVGDAAGRLKDWLPGKKKDFSVSDRLFASNIGIKFFTPEEYFLGHSATSKFEMPKFNPQLIDTEIELLEPKTASLVSNKQEIIVLVGFPAAGKSHFVRKHLCPKGYIHINRDKMKTWQKCVQATQDSIGRSLSVVIDNTNPDKESRKRYVDVARNAGISCRCFIMSTSIEHARHNEKFREMTDSEHEKISEMVFNSYKSKYVEPKDEEGFDEIIRVNFIPDFRDSTEQTMYQQFLLEK